MNKNTISEPKTIALGPRAMGCVRVLEISTVTLSGSPRGADPIGKIPDALGDPDP